MGGNIRRRRLPPSPAAPSLARSSVDEWARSWRLPRNTTGELRLLVSEVVTNSVRHAASSDEEEIELRALAEADRVHVEVADAGEGFRPSVVRSPPQGQSGWGSFLLERLASDWGAVRRGGRNVVWFDLPKAS